MATDADAVSQLTEAMAVMARENARLKAVNADLMARLSYVHANLAQLNSRARPMGPPNQNMGGFGP